jgi:hypothetical protein
MAQQDQVSLTLAHSQRKRTPHMQIIIQVYIKSPTLAGELTAVSTHKDEFSGEGRSVVQKMKLLALLCIVTASHGECPYCNKWVPCRICDWQLMTNDSSFVQVFFPTCSCTSQDLA